MRVLMLSKACIVGIYQPKLEAIARAGVDLLVLTPPSWRDERGIQRLERSHAAGYELRAIPIRFNGNFHLHHYPTLAREIASFQPQIAHIDEEAYNLATWQALRLARRNGAKALFFTWQNILRAYPPPFNWGERWVMRAVDYALAGSDDAAAVLRRKGYRGPLRTIPQFGTSTALFHPAGGTAAASLHHRLHRPPGAGEGRRNLAARCRPTRRRLAAAPGRRRLGCG